MGDLPPATNTNGAVKRLRSPTNKKGGEVPPWVLVMIEIMTYKDCSIHSTDKLDRFCINCSESFCNECSSNHQGHKHVKIRRYTLRDVINRPDFQKHFDCSGIQGYVTNKNKVLHLRERGDNQQLKGQQNTSYPSCMICNHTLIDAIYCSIQCKVGVFRFAIVLLCLYFCMFSVGFRMMRLGMGHWSSGIEESLSTKRLRVQVLFGTICISAMKTENTEVTTTENTEVTATENKESKNEGELENALDNAILEPSKTKRTRKGVPNRAPFI
ncbi:uncharacterized protein [Rutidosis leptorrhynchoides]|uniref:uncharacterized protein n=1 Tax=Rutidosis leptorrhynchoides TaxID=125765 RepID=UPI003A99D401